MIRNLAQLFGRFEAFGSCSSISLIHPRFPCQFQRLADRITRSSILVRPKAASLEAEGEAISPLLTRW